MTEIKQTLNKINKELQGHNKLCFMFIHNELNIKIEHYDMVLKQCFEITESFFEDIDKFNHTINECIDKIKKYKFDYMKNK